MSFLIINAIPITTIDDLNSRFNLHLSRIVVPGTIDIDEDREFYEVKKFMESNTEVNYECNKY